MTTAEWITASLVFIIAAILRKNDENVGTLIRCITKVAKTQPMADIGVIINKILFEVY